MAKRFRFNLLIKREKALLSEAISFLNNYAKYAIVLTQILVLFVFFIKIVLDQSVIDLKETIDQKNQIILTAKEMIENNNVIAEKLTNIANIIEVDDYNHRTLKLILANVPESVVFTNAQLNNNKFSFEGECENSLDIQKMQLKLEKEIKKKVLVEQINKKGGVYYFKLLVENEEQKS
jgi:hypothetical protein